MSRVELLVNGQRYGGWEDVSITRGIEALVGSFDLSVSERWSGQAEPWAIREGDECSLYAADELVITGYVDRRSLRISASAHSLTVSGRDRAADLIDSAVLLPRWEFWGQSVLKVAQVVAQATGIKVTSENSAGAAMIRRVVRLNPGDTGASVLEQLGKHAGVLFTSDGRGAVVITRAGARRATTALVLGIGGNLLTAEASFDQSQRFRRYAVMGQSPWSNDDGAEVAAFTFGEASDEGARDGRVMVIRPEGGVESVAIAKQRARWEASVRAARASTLEVTVQGWQQADGTLWPVNALVPVQAPQVGIDAEMLITQARYQLNAAGTITVLSLKRPDAFLPEPVVDKAPWEELSGVS